MWLQTLNFAAILPSCYTLLLHSHMNLHTFRMKTGQRGILLGGWAEMSAAVLDGEEDSEKLLAYCKDSNAKVQTRNWSCHNCNRPKWLLNSWEQHHKNRNAGMQQVHHPSVKACKLSEDNVLFMDTAPHAPLFPRCKVIVHHGHLTLSMMEVSGFCSCKVGQCPVVVATLWMSPNVTPMHFCVQFLGSSTCQQNEHLLISLHLNIYIHSVYAFRNSSLIFFISLLVNCSRGRWYIECFCHERHSYRDSVTLVAVGPAQEIPPAWPRVQPNVSIELIVFSAIMDEGW